MRYERKKSFDRIFKKLDIHKQNLVVTAIEKLLSFYESGIKPEGLGLKHLKKDIWEVRSSIRERILFSVENDLLSFLLIGNHDEVKSFLRDY